MMGTDVCETPRNPADVSASDVVRALAAMPPPVTAGGASPPVLDRSERDAVGFLAIISLEGRRTILLSTTRFCSTNIVVDDRLADKLKESDGNVGLTLPCVALAAQIAKLSNENFDIGRVLSRAFQSE